MQIKIHRTSEIGATLGKERDLTILGGETHNANDILYYTRHTQFVKTRDSLVSGKKKKKIPFFFFLFEVDVVCFVVVGRMKLFCIKRNARKKNPISPRSAGSSF